MLCKGRRVGATRTAATVARKVDRRRGGLDFPWAHVRTFAELPARCDRDAGIWNPVETGVVCVLCGRERIVAEALRARTAGRAAAARAWLRGLGTRA